MDASLEMTSDPIFGDLDCNDNTPVMQPFSPFGSTSLISPGHCLSNSPPPWINDMTSPDLVTSDPSHSVEVANHANMSIELQRSAEEFFYDDEFALDYDGTESGDVSPAGWLTASLVCLGTSEDTWWSVPERLAASDGCLQHMVMQESVKAHVSDDGGSDDVSHDEPLFTSQSAADSATSSLLSDCLTDSGGDKYRYDTNTNQYTLAFDPGGERSSTGESSLYEGSETETRWSWAGASTTDKLEHSCLVRASSDAPLTTWRDLTEEEAPMTSWGAIEQASVGADSSVSLPEVRRREMVTTKPRPASCGDENPHCSLFELFQQRAHAQTSPVVSPGALRRLTGTWSMSGSSHASPTSPLWPAVCDSAVQTDGKPNSANRSLQTSISLLPGMSPEDLIGMMPEREEVAATLKRYTLPMRGKPLRACSQFMSRWGVWDASAVSLPDLGFLNTHQASPVASEMPKVADTPKRCGCTAPRSDSVSRIHGSDSNNSCCSSSSSGIDAGSYHEGCSAVWRARDDVARCETCRSTGMVASHPRDTRPVKPDRRLDCLHVSPTHGPQRGVWVSLGEHPGEHPGVWISLGDEAHSQRPLKPCLVRRRRSQKPGAALKHRSWSDPQDAAIMRYSNEGETRYQLLTPPHQSTSLPPEELMGAVEPRAIPLPPCPCRTARAVLHSSSESEDGATNAVVRGKKSVSFSEKVCYASPHCSPQCSPRRARKVHCSITSTSGGGKQAAVSDLQTESLSHDTPSDDEPPNSFLVSPPSERQPSLHVAGREPDWQDMLLDITKASAPLEDFFQQRSNCADQLDSSQSQREAGQLVLQHVCPAVHAVVTHGLKTRVRSLFGMVKNNVWTMVEESADLGPSTIHELVTDLKKLPFLETVQLKFNAFIFGLLNFKVLDVWLTYIHASTSLLQRHYHPNACLSLSSQALPLRSEALPLRHAFVVMTTSLQPVSRLPLRLAYDLEYETMWVRVERSLAQYLLKKHIEGVAPTVPAPSVDVVPASSSPSEGWVGRLRHLGNRVFHGRPQDTLPIPTLLPTLQSRLEGHSEPSTCGAIIRDNEIVAAEFVLKEPDVIDCKMEPVYKKGVTEYAFDTDKGGVSTQDGVLGCDKGVRGNHLSCDCQDDSNDRRNMKDNDDEKENKKSGALKTTKWQDRMASESKVMTSHREATASITQATPITCETTPTLAESTPTQHHDTDYYMTQLTSSAAQLWQGPVKRKLNWFGLSLIGAVDRLLLPPGGRVTSDKRRSSGETAVSGVVGRSMGGMATADRRVRARCSYVAGDPQHLSFIRGSELAVKGRLDADWLICHQGDQEGLVHTACVQPIE